ncbi:ABC transporter transmembrane domain-containing protein [Rickettsiales bacterium]|nr:ABC transporter transmembrane domain-containing protein [Rickettsiales bacterium]
MQVADKLNNNIDKPQKSKSGNVFCNPKQNKFYLIALSISINILSLSLPITLLHFYDRILPTKHSATLIILVSVAIAAISLEAVLKIIRSYMLSWSASYFEHDVTHKAINNFIEANLKETSKEGKGEHLQNINAISKIKEFYSGALIQNYIDISFVVILLSIIFYIASWLVLVPISLLAFFSISMIFFSNRLKSDLSKKDDTDADRYNFLIESLQGIHTIKSLGLEPIFSRRYEKLEENSTITSHQPSLNNSIINNYGALFTNIMIVCIIFFGSIMVINHDITMGTLVATVLLTGRIIPPVQRGIALSYKWQDFSIAMKKVSSFFDMEKIQRDKNICDIEKKGVLSISNLSFKYPDSDEKIIDNINIDLKFGDTISISGNYGSGKTTLIKLICGLIVPDGGSIKIDDIEASKYSDIELRRHIAYMATDSEIFTGTIKDNITAFCDEYESNAMEIAKLLEIDKEVRKLPDGYETMLYDNQSDPISPGIKQRISLARVLSPKPKILLFDNSDKSLDTRGYECIVKLLAKLKGKATMIIVSDDCNILDFAKHEYVLEDGQLQERSFDQNSKFYDLKPYKEFTI